MGSAASAHGGAGGDAEAEPQGPVELPTPGEAPAEVVATLRYTRNTDEQQGFDAKRDLKGQKQKLPTRHTTADVRMRNARVAESPPRFDTHGFQLYPQATALSNKDFRSNPSRITGAYYEEIAEVIKRATGAQSVKCFHHLVRSAAVGKEGLGSAVLQPPAPVVHCDYTFMNAMTLFHSMAPPDWKGGRFAVINAWRNIADYHIEDDTLACCDARTVVAPDDFVPFSFIDAKGHKSNSYHVDPGHSAMHEWYYYPKMVRDEVLLFMQYDSNPRAAARYTPHLSFKDPSANEAMAEAFPRQSIEVRALAFFPDHRPNTVPVDFAPVNDKVARWVHDIMESLNYASKWDSGGYNWMATTIRKPNGVQETIKGLVNHKHAKSHPRHVDAIIAGLMKRQDQYKQRALRNFPLRDGGTGAGGAGAGGAGAGTGAGGAGAGGAGAGAGAGAGGFPGAGSAAAAAARTPASKEAKVIDTAVKKIMQAVSHPMFWKGEHKRWMRTELHKPDGTAAVLNAMVADGVNVGRYGLRGADKYITDVVISTLLSGSFEAVARKNFPPL